MSGSASAAVAGAGPTAGPPDGPPSTVDWRLVPAAIALWLSGLAGLLLAWWWAVLIGASAVLTGVLLLGARGLSDDPRPRWVRRGVALSLMICGLLAAVFVGARLHAAQTHPLRDYAAHGWSARVLATVADRPRPVFATGFGGRPGGVRSVVVTVELAEAAIAAPAGPVTLTDPPAQVLVLAPVAEWSAVLPGQEVVAEGTLDMARSGELTVAWLRVRGPPAKVGSAPYWQRVAETMRAGLRGVSGVLSPEEAGLLPAIVVGDTAALPRRVVEEFRVAGMSHLLAVSGANLAIVGGAVLLLLRVLRVGPRLAALAAMLALLGFVVLAGSEPSVLRAAVMGGVGLLALAIGRRHAALPALAVAVVVLVLHDPGMAVNFGFALSVLATAALVLLAPRWALAMRQRGVPRGIAEALAVPAAAHLVTAPVVAGMSGEVSLVAVLANLLAAPVVAPATVLGLLAALVAGPLPWLAELFVWLAAPEVGWLVLVGRQAAGLPSASVPWPSGWWGGLLLLVITVAVGWALRNRRLRTLIVAVLLGVLLTIVPAKVVAPSWPPAGWTAVACDVGQGDAMVLATGEPDRAVLVDTGPEPGAVGECLGRLGVSRVPLVVLSHLHADHIGGLAAVLADQAVGAVAIGSARLPGWAWDQVRAEAARAGVPVVWLAAGQRLTWPGLVVDVLGPRHVDGRTEGEATGTEINNGSVVLRATTPSGRLLLTGDVELDAQADLLNSGVDLAAEVLKVPHHGSRYTSPEFLAAVRPRVALISVGAGNDYGHPSPVTERSLTSAGALVLRTDRDGDTAVVTDGGDLSVVRRGAPRAPPRR